MVVILFLSLFSKCFKNIFGFFYIFRRRNFDLFWWYCVIRGSPWLRKTGNKFRHVQEFRFKHTFPQRILFSQKTLFQVKFSSKYFDILKKWIFYSRIFEYNLPQLSIQTSGGLCIFQGDIQHFFFSYKELI